MTEPDAESLDADAPTLTNDAQSPFVEVTSDDAAAEDVASADAELDECDGGRRVGEFSQCVPFEGLDGGVLEDAAAADAETAAADAETLDAQLSDGQVPDALAEDANMPTDAAQNSDTDSGTTPPPVCGGTVYDCGNELLRPLAAGGGCSFSWFGGLEVNFRVCEDCGSTRTTYTSGVVIRSCGGCEQRYAIRGGAGGSLSGGACTNARYTADYGLSGTDVAGDTCVDVYASTQSTIYDNANGALFRPEQLAHVCRCDMHARTCAACSAGGCPSLTP